MCKDSTEFHVLCAQFPLVLTSCITTVIFIKPKKQ